MLAHSLLALAALVTPAAAVTLSNTLGDHMVLQAGAPGALVWGFDAPGVTVTTTLDGVQHKATTGADGVWRQRLPPCAASFTARTILFASSDGSTAALQDVLFGSVFVMAGQSNAQFSVAGAFNATAEIAAATYPNIRVFTVGQGTGKGVQKQLVTTEQNWTRATPNSIGGGGDFGYFSAIAWFFGRDVYNALGNTPIGLISNNWGGTCLQEWAPASVSAACNVTTTPNLFDAMYTPYITGPMLLSGFLWSQGECNADSNTTAYYACAFAPFIDSWRSAFGVPNAFFGFELLPAYIRDSKFDPSSLPYERASQLTALALGGNVVTANALDLGDPQAPHGSVHPRNKQTVGARFAAAALSLLYATPTPYVNPAYASATAVTAGATIAVTVTFDPATVVGGLTLVPGECPVALGVPQAECAWHEVQTADGAWLNATTTLTADGMGVVLTVTTPTPGAQAVATRGMFSPWPVVTLYSRVGALPALPWNARL